MNDQGSNNLYKVLEPPPHVTWKTAPDPNWLCAHSELWKLYLAKASNGVLPAKKHRTSLLKLQERREMNFTTKPKKTPEDYADTVDEWVRVGLSHLRTLKQNPQARARAMRKLDTNQIGNLQEVLDMIQGLEKRRCSRTMCSGSSPEIGQQRFRACRGSYSKPYQQRTTRYQSTWTHFQSSGESWPGLQWMLAAQNLKRLREGPAQRARVVLPRQAPKGRTQALKRILEDS